MEKTINEYLKEGMSLKAVDIKTYSPLSFAYIGDCVYELIIRTKIVTNGNTQVNKYHKKASALVKAETQAKIMVGIEEYLTDEEMDIFKRGRNAKSYTTAKNASMIDYKMATGFEALIGYLYLTEKLERIIDLVKLGLNVLDYNE